MIAISATKLKTEPAIEKTKKLKLIANTAKKNNRPFVINYKKNEQKC